jgi:hypothetical protein
MGGRHADSPRKRRSWATVLPQQPFISTPACERPNHAARILADAGCATQLFCDYPHLFNAGLMHGFHAALQMRGRDGDVPRFRSAASDLSRELIMVISRSFPGACSHVFVYDDRVSHVVGCQ